MTNALAVTNVLAVIDALSAAAEPTRRRILQLLASRPRTVSNIAAEFTVTRSAISQHLLLLAEVGLVAAEKVGRERVYRVVPEGLRRVQAEIDRIGPCDTEVGLKAFGYPAALVLRLLRRREFRLLHRASS